MKLKKISKLRSKWHDIEHGTHILFQSLNKIQKKLIIIALSVMVVAGFVITIKARNVTLVEQPIPGGEWVEGLVGNPRFINPVLANSNIDKDLTTLVHSGLLKRLPDGNYVGDLAESYSIDKNGLEYTFILKDDIEFHDGKPVTSEDVVYTIDRIKDPLEKSPRSVEWQGVNVKKIDERTITMTLKQPFADFLDIATIGILPKHVYSKYNTDSFSQARENIKAIGAGPYKIKRVTTKNNLPKTITLEKARRGYQNGYIKKIVFNFYENEDQAIAAFTSGKIDHLGSVNARNAKDLKDRGYTITLASFPRLYGIFFNTKDSSILKQPRATEIIAAAIDKQAIVDSVLNGFGDTIDAPVPANIANELNYPYQKIDLVRVMKSSGWEKNENGIWEKTITKTTPGSKKTEKSTESFSFTITTSDTPELRNGAEQIAVLLKENGILANVASFDSATLEEKIRTRDYEALYYGIQISRESQVYAFWHSSQREHPGLNISGYTNSKIDTILEELQKETNPDDRNTLWKKFITTFYNDMPAVFIYSPSYIYLHRETPLFTMPVSIHGPDDRFINIREWYLETEKVIPFLQKNKTLKDL